MEFLLTTYAVAWAIVTAYVVWLGVGNTRLARRLERLEALGQQQSNETGRAKVA